MLFALKTAYLLTFTLISITFAQSDSTQTQNKAASSAEAKLDLQKVYNEALTWSKEKIQEIPTVNLEEANIGRCEGEPALAIPEFSKNSNQQVEKKTQGTGTDKEDKTQLSSEPEILVFVSLSLPKESLIALAKDAQMHNAKLIIRGVKNNSFKEMLKAIQSLGKELEGAIEVNPELFKEYKVTAVPTFVLVKDHKEVNRLRGNVSLNFAAQKLKAEI